MVEARSLANLVELADNPPIHYQENVDAYNQPLVLYVARVPGSKGMITIVLTQPSVTKNNRLDFFLTTIKPLEKMVRAEDVQSCLYYIHVGSKRDEDLRREEKERIDEEQNNQIHESIEEKSGVPAIRRKPLPLNPALSPQKRPETPPKVFPHYQPLSRSTFTPESGEAVKDWKPASTSPKRKIVGPRLMQNQPCPNHQLAESSLSNENVDIRSLAPSLPFRHATYIQKQREFDMAYAANAAPLVHTTREGQGYQSPLKNTKTCTSAPSLTLIRRYDANQLNAATIHADGRLIISCPGYQKCGSQEFSNGNIPDLQDGQFPEEQQPGYECILHLTSRSQSHGDWAGAESIESFQGAQRKRSSLDVRRYSQQVLSESAMKNHEHLGGPVATSQGYTFKTPWNGICEFKTGVAGRSVKCKSLPTTSAKPDTISDLRFNLPSSQMLRSSPNVPQAGAVGATKRTSYLGKRHHRVTTSTSEDSPHITPADVPDEINLDLSLGQEHAGGGFGGKQAKLGKLVIEPKGMQMLDLLVAANMSIWWKVYGKLT
ncbi:uncharacterized protein KY384_005934 [Bacidia gigantensis]|uniref:uncharacterized protein n=1 Tax=Bacidia gigantensis TaxID=2732470 RepID=UPI001D05B798|nr:uncharacterized protein KY384_005934 [Bacidia gigantensis]KAG8529298.1 hypothetical protein KY384_005934 [Bacidia gigantensis]